MMFDQPWAGLAASRPPLVFDIQPKIGAEPKYTS